MESFISQPTAHNHAPIPEKIHVIELTNQIKSRAATSEEHTSAILHTALRSFPLSAATELPRTEMLLQTIRRKRCKPSTGRPNEIPEELRKTDRGEDFLFYQDNEIIILTTKSNLSALKESKHWFADGTFSVNHQSPFDSTQLISLFLSLGLSKRFLSAVYPSCADEKKQLFL